MRFKSYHGRFPRFAALFCRQQITSYLVRGTKVSRSHARLTDYLASGHRELPADWPKTRLMLVMVLWRQRVTSGGHFVHSTTCATVNAAVRRRGTRGVDLIKSTMVAVLKILGELVDSHFAPLYRLPFGVRFTSVQDDPGLLVGGARRCSGRVVKLLRGPPRGPRSW